MSAPTLQPLQIGQITQSPYNFIDEQHLPATLKWQVLNDWRWFIQNGFAWQFFTTNIYTFLWGYCQFAPQDSQQHFWFYYFHSDPQRLQAIISQFGGNKLSAETGNYEWLGGIATDLKQAMCQEISKVHEPIMQILTDMESNHNYLAALWFNFAQQAGFKTLNTFPAFTIGENAHNLIAYAVMIALNTTPPIKGLQLMFPQFAVAQPGYSHGTVLQTVGG
jgi:hypothetical protein